MKDNITFIHPELERMNINNLWHEALVRFCGNMNNNYTRLTNKRMTMNEINQIIDATLIIMMEQNGIPVKEESFDVDDGK